MANLEWPDFEDVFSFDGSGLDLYIADADMGTWQSVWNALRKSGGKIKAEYFIGDELVPLPADVVDAFPEEGWSDRMLAATMSAAGGAVVFNCHFFALDEIELDFDPREVKGQSQLDALIAFMRVLADASGKDVVLTEENAHDDPILVVQPGAEGAEDLRGGGGDDEDDDFDDEDD